MKANNTKINGFNISGSNASGFAGIFLYYSNYCTIENNKLSNNICGIYHWFANRNNIVKNTVTNNGIYGGILLQASNFNTVTGNKVFNNARGIYLATSTDNTVSSNTVEHSTGDWGFFVCGKSPRSLIYNNYFNETNLTIKKTHDPEYVNTLYITKTAGTNIVGGPFIGGNYWAKPDGTGFSQTAVDNDGDGISDSVYTNVSGSTYSDYLPLVIHSKPPAPILPVANFNSNVTSGNTPLTVLFNSTSTNADNVSWNFSDGTTAVTGTPVSHTFTNKGTSAQTFTVTLTAINLNGKNTKTGTITVNPAAVAKPVASFTVSPTSGGTTATNYTFTDNSTNSPINWTWNFDDGGTASGKIVTHKYTTAKTYNVTLTAGNTAGNATATKSVVVNSAVVKPVASFTVSPASGGTTATTYTFTDTSPNTPTSRSWNFGDGGTASGKSVTHKYTTAKIYTVTLTAGYTADKATATKSVTVSATKPPVASFTYSPATVKKGATIQFTDISTNTPNKWKWTFGDGSAAVISQNPKHVFSKTGSFKVYLTASNNIGSNTATKTITVS